MSAEETKVKEFDRFCVLKLGGLIAVIYWLIATIRSTILIADSSFFVNLYYPGFWDLFLRIVTVAGIIGASFKLQQRLNEINAEKDLLDAELTGTQFLIEAADCPIIELDHQLRIKKVNKAAAVLTGTKAEDLEFKDVLSALFYPDDQEEIRLFLEQSQQETLDRIVRIKVRRMQRCYAAVQVAKEIVNEKVNRQLLFLNDVSELVAKLAETEKRTADIINLLDHNPTPILLLDSHQIHLHNRAVQNAVHIPADQLTLETLTEFVRTNCQDPEALLKAAAQASEEQTVQEIETVISIDGQPRNLIVHFVPFDSESKSYAVWVKDLTELHQRDDAIKELEQQLAAAHTTADEIRAEYQQHTEACSSERKQLIDQLTSEQQKTSDLTAELAALKEQIAQQDAALMERASDNQLLQEKLAQLQQDNTQLLTDLDLLQYQLEAIELPIMQVDLTGRLTKINTAAKTLLGLNENEMLQSYLSGEQPAKIGDLLQRLAAGEPRIAAELEFVKNDHKIIVSCHGIKLNQPENHFLLYGYDITAFRQAQAELALTLDNSRFELEDVLNEIEIERERMNAILAGINDGIVITDMYNRVVKMNPKAEDILGIRLSQALERPVHFIIRNHEIVGHIQKTVREKLYNHEFTIDVSVPYDHSTNKLACSTTVIHDRNLHDQGVIIQLRKADAS